MLNPREVEGLLDDTRNASKLLLNLVKAKAGIADLRAGLEAIRTPAAKLLHMQAAARKDGGQIVRHFAPSMCEAYNAVAEAGSVINAEKWPDLFHFAMEVNGLLRSLDEPPASVRS
jgi:hypothetical protein